MRVVLQRVSSARVTVAGKVTGEIGKGLLLLAGFTATDTADAVDWMADKIATLRIFGDDAGKINLALEDVSGGVLVVSQFTLYGDAAKGRRPSFIAAAPPEIATPMYERFVEAFRVRGHQVATGEFGAMMNVELVNDGPVTLVLER